MSPQRRFGTPSRAANSKPYDKVEGAVKSPDKVAKGAVDFILNQEPVVHPPVGHATRLAPGIGTPTLDLPFIKDESFGAFNTPSHVNGTPQESQEKYEKFQDLQEQHVDSPGMPTHAQWQAIVDTYLRNLHERKRDKALITRTMHEMIFETLSNPESTRVGTPQFRFWARKMFQLVEIAGVSVITHTGRPVAVKEHMYEILCMCHAESDHAGRDKTCKVLRNYYTWIPKELVANFVKACPTCAKKRAFDALIIDTTQINQLVIPKTESTCMTTPSPMTESPMPGNSLSLTGPLLTGGPSDSCSHQGPYTTNGTYHASGQLPMPQIIPVPLTELARRSSYPFELNALGLIAIQNDNNPGDEKLTLPPLNKLVEASSESKIDAAKEMSGDYFRGQGVTNTSLPPLMRYLTKDGGMIQTDIPLHLPSGSAAGSLPIDPSLLGDVRHGYSGPSTSSCSSRPSRSFPPTPLLTIGILGGPALPEETAFVAHEWRRANADVPSSVSPNSQMPISPFSSSPALFSPIPMKVGERSPILELPSDTTVEAGGSSVAAENTGSS